MASSRDRIAANIATVGIQTGTRAFRNCKKTARLRYESELRD